MATKGVSFTGAITGSTTKTRLSQKAAPEVVLRITLEAMATDVNLETLRRLQTSGCVKIEMETTAPKLSGMDES